ncbi:MAG: ATP-binding protein, partial [Pseudomonadota bacterium]
MSWSRSPLLKCSIQRCAAARTACSCLALGRLTASQPDNIRSTKRAAKIFDTFQQIDNSMSRKTDGTGLGLTISKRLARLIDAELSVESKLGEGSI